MPRHIDTRGSVSPDDLLSPGWWPALITDVEEVISRAGNQCWIVTFVIRDENGRRRRIPRWYVNTPRALFFLRDLLIATGIPESDLRGEFVFDEDDLIGTRVEVQVGEEEYRGQVKNTIRRTRAVTGLITAQQVERDIAPAPEPDNQAFPDAGPVSEDVDDDLDHVSVYVLPFHVFPEYMNPERTTYDLRGCAAFRTTAGPYGELSNFNRELPVKVGETTWRTSEALYQACKFPGHPDLQLRILAALTPFEAKTIGRESEGMRADWEDVKIDVMHWVLHAKVLTHWELFVNLLLELSLIHI